MAKDILKEAIADAKAVREVALANAKAALEEAFTPRLQSMLSAKLSEELNEEEDLDETYMEDKEEIEETYEEDVEKKEVSEEVTDLDEEIDLEEILNELELEEGEDSEDTVDEAKKDDDDKMEEAKHDDKDDVKEAKDEDKDDMKEAKDKDDDKVEEAKDDKEDLDENRPVYKAEDANYAGYTADRVHEDKEFDLDNLLEEINNLDENEEEVEEVTRNTSLRGDTADDKETHDWYNQQYQEGETNEVVGVAAGIAGLIAAAGGLSALEMAADDPEWRAKYPKVAKALETMQAMGKAAGDAKRMEEEAKDKELEETKAALEAVTTELNEVNLLNSKLLYVNRIFKANTLNEAQKLRVVETLDNASNVKEAKLIYETIKDTFTVAKTTKTTPKKSIRENLGMASKAAGTSTAPKKPVLNESNDMVTRMQKLANIKINQ